MCVCKCSRQTHLDLEDGEAVDPGNKLGEVFFPCSTHTNQLLGEIGRVGERERERERRVEREREGRGEREREREEGREREGG